MSGKGVGTRSTSTRAPATAQLELLEAGAVSWRLDRHTRDIGRQGVAKARQVLRSAGGGDTSADRRHAA